MFCSHLATSEFRAISSLNGYSVSRGKYDIVEFIQRVLPAYSTLYINWLQMFRRKMIFFYEGQKRRRYKPLQNICNHLLRFKVLGTTN